MSQREAKQQEIKINKQQQDREQVEKLPFPPITIQDISTLRQNSAGNYAQSLLSESPPPVLRGIVSEMDVIAILNTLSEHDRW